MEHHHQLLHLSPQEHIMFSSGFFDIGGADLAHFHAGGGFVDIPVADAAAGIDDSGWMEDLMQLGDELFGSGNNVVVDDMGDHQAWQQCEASPDDQPSLCLDGDASPPSGEQAAGEIACEPSRDDGDLSATRKRRDRSKTIVSERRRRVRMKEKLYELRSLVPNITKMDKASIIADAVVYVKNLQSHAKKLKEEVAMLEARPRSPGRQQHAGQRRSAARRQGQHGSDNGEGSSGSGSGLRHGSRVTHIGAAPVGEGRFFVTVECERRDGVAAPLCASVESLACFRVESSNLGCSSARVVSTLTLKVYIYIFFDSSRSLLMLKNSTISV